MNPNTSTWPSGDSGMMRMMVKGMKVSRSRAVRRSADTSRGLSVLPGGFVGRGIRKEKQAKDSSEGCLMSQGHLAGLERVTWWVVAKRGHLADTRHKEGVTAERQSGRCESSRIRPRLAVRRNRGGPTPACSPTQPTDSYLAPVPHTHPALPSGAPVPQIFPPPDHYLAPAPHT